MNIREWLISVIIYYRNLNFFKKYSNLSNSQIASILEKQHQENNGDGGIFKSRREEDVIALDEDRIIPICFEDIYPDPFDDKLSGESSSDFATASKIISTILWELSEISRGFFKPRDIEYLSYQDGMALVKIIFDNLECKLFLESIDDPSLVASKVNPILKHTGYQFEI